MKHKFELWYNNLSYGLYTTYDDALAKVRQHKMLPDTWKIKRMLVTW